MTNGNCLVKTVSQEQLTITKRPTVDNVNEICNSDSERDKSGSTIQKTLTDESLGQETKSADGQNSHTDTPMTCVEHFNGILMNLLQSTPDR